MKNITVTVDEGLYERSRVLAAERRTTITGLVREYLTGLVDEKRRREEAREQLQAMAGSFGGKIGRIPRREERNARG